MDDTQLEHAFGKDLCRFFSHEFVRTYLRLNLSRGEFFNQLLKSILQHETLQTKLICPYFWIELLEQLDLKYTVNDCYIHTGISWLSAAKHFFMEILPNVGSYECGKNRRHRRRLNHIVNLIFTEKKFESIQNLLDFLEQTYRENVMMNSSSCDNETESQKNTIESSETIIIENCIVTNIEDSDTTIVNINNSSITDVDVGSLNEEEKEEELNNKSLSIVENNVEKVVDMHNQLDVEPKDTTQRDKDVISLPNAKISPITNDTDIAVFTDEENIEQQTDIEVTKTVPLDSDSLKSVDISGFWDESDSERDTSVCKLTPRKRNKVFDSFELDNKRNIRKNKSKRPLNSTLEREGRAILQVALKKPDLPDIQLQRFRKRKIPLRIVSTEESDQNNKLEERLADSDPEQWDCSSVSSNYSIISNRNIGSEKYINKLFDNKAKNAYSLEEDVKLIQYIVEHGQCAGVKGNALWMDIESKRLLFGRSWQSMKERFCKHIAHNLSIYFELERIDRKTLELLEENINFVPPKLGSNKIVENTISKVRNKNYTSIEDEELLKFIMDKQIETNFQNTLTGKYIWELAEKHFDRNFVHPRSWQSLKERFHKRIAPRLHTFNCITSYKVAETIVNECVRSKQAEIIIQKLKAKFRKA